MEVGSIKKKKWCHERTFSLNVYILLYYRFLLNKRFDRRKELGRKAWMHFEVIFLRFSSVLLSRERAWPYMASLLAIKVGCLGRRKAATYSLHSSLACIYQTIARLRETRFATTYHIGRDAASILLCMSTNEFQHKWCVCRRADGLSWHSARVFVASNRVVAREGLEGPEGPEGPWRSQILQI